MAKIKFTAGRIDDFTCEVGKGQSFLWDSTAPGLGVRSTANGAKSYMFQAKLNGRAMRITIGSPKTWTLPEAQAEARRLKVVIDSGRDPRELKATKLAEQRIAQDALNAAAARATVTLGSVWPEYVAERSSFWSKAHIKAHRQCIQAGGEPRWRSSKLTTPGPLASIANLPLAELTTERFESWAIVEALARPSSARLSARLLKAFLNWCSVHPAYSVLVPTNAAKSAKAREALGKPKLKHDLLQREQLQAWFDAVRQIPNPVISAYLQTLLLTGARREEIARLRWNDVDFRWNSMKLGDKVEDFRMIPLTPYVASLLSSLTRRNEWVFSSPTAAEGYIAEPRYAHNQAIAIAGLPHLTLHGLRRSFATLSEWVETPAGIAAQIQGHAPQGVREQNYIRRPLDLLRMWHVKIEAWILEQADVELPVLQAGLALVQRARE